MARKRRAPSPPPPPPPPPQESSSESGSETEEEEEEEEDPPRVAASQNPPRAAASQNPPLNPQPQALAAAADGTDTEEEESDSEEDAQAFQMRPVGRSPAPNPGPDAANEEEDDESEPEAPEPTQKKKAAATKRAKTAEPEDKKRPAPKPAAVAPNPGSDADEEEDGDSEPEVPEPAQKKAAAASKKSKAAEPEDKKRPAPEPAPSGRAKKAKAEKAAPEATSAGKAKKPRRKGDKSGLDSPPPSAKSDKPARAHRTWSKEDLVKILEALAAHVRTEGALPKTEVLLAAVRDRLDRTDCSHSDIYERVRRLKDRYEKAVSTGVVPSAEDELQMYNLSDAVWGEKAKEAIAAAASQNGPTATKSKKGQSSKEKMDGNLKGGAQKEVANHNADTQKGGKKGQAANGDATTATPSKTKKQGNGKEELGKSAKSGTVKEAATTAAQNGDALAKRKGGKMDMDIDPVPKEASTGRQSGGSQTEEETHQEETEIEGTHRSSDELQNLYPNLAWCVDRIEAHHPCGDSLKRAFELIRDDKADALESKLKTQRISEVKVQIRRKDVEKEVLNLLIGLGE